MSVGRHTPQVQEWKAGTPIVSFSAHPARHFFVIMGKATEMLVASVCPHTRTYNDAIVQQLFDRPMEDMDSPGDTLALHNQNLSGFFVSIPQNGLC